MQTTETKKREVNPKAELRKNLRKEFFKGNVNTSMSAVRFKMKVNRLFFLDKVQTTLFNQIRGCSIDEIICYDEEFPKIEELRRTENTDGDKKKRAKMEKEALVRQVNKSLDAIGSDEVVTEKNVEEYVTELAREDYENGKITQFFELFEDEEIKELRKYMDANLPVYQWCKEVRGLGDKLTAKLLAGIKDIRRFPNPASLWSYCGVGDASKEKRQTGNQLSHSPKMRATLYNLQEAFIKAGSQYRVIYDKRKEKTLKTHPEWHNLTPCPVKNVGKDAPKTDDKGNVSWKNMHPKHAHVDASRVMIKRFLAELFAAWYQSLGQEPPAKPYGVEIEGHHEDPMIVPFVGKRHLVEFVVEEDE